MYTNYVLKFPWILILCVIFWMTQDPDVLWCCSWVSWFRGTRLKKIPQGPTHSWVFQHPLDIWTLSKSNGTILKSIFSHRGHMQDCAQLLQKHSLMLKAALLEKGQIFRICRKPKGCVGHQIGIFLKNSALLNCSGQTRDLWTIITKQGLCKLWNRVIFINSIIISDFWTICKHLLCEISYSGQY